MFNKDPDRAGCTGARVFRFRQSFQIGVRKKEHIYPDICCAVSTIDRSCEPSRQETPSSWEKRGRRWVFSFFFFLYSRVFVFVGGWKGCAETSERKAGTRGSARDAKWERRDRDETEAVETCGKLAQGMQIRDWWYEDRHEGRGHFRCKKKSDNLRISALYSRPTSGPVAPILCKSPPRDQRLTTSLLRVCLTIFRSTRDSRDALRIIRAVWNVVTTRDECTIRRKKNSNSV